MLSLVSAAQSAVEMSALAATAAEDAMAAAKLANVHAKAALAVAELALELQNKMKIGEEAKIESAERPLSGEDLVHLHNKYHPSLTKDMEISEEQEQAENG